MPRANLPDEIVRLLSFHGRVELWTGRGDKACTTRVELAPFDDELILVIPPGSPAEEGLLQTSRAQVLARADDQSYSLRLNGRAIAGRTVAAHPRRSAIVPWLGEGSRPDRLLAIPFVAEDVELIREDGPVRNRYAGPTPEGKASPDPVRRWLQAGLGGGGKWLAIAGLAASFAWFGYQGADFPYRGLALLLAWIAALGVVGGIRLLGQAAAFLRWRSGRGDPRRAPMLHAGHVAPEEARRAGVYALGMAALCLLVLRFFPEGTGSVLVVLLATGSPLLAGSWVLHAWVAARGGEDG